MKKPLVSRPAHVVPLILAEILIGSFLAAISFLLFFDLSHRILTENFMLLDHSIMNTLYAFRSPGLTQLMLALTFLGSSHMLLFSSVSIFIVLLYRRYRHEAVLFGITFVMGVLLNLLFKEVIARARPDIAPLLKEAFYSFPSGHSMNAFIFYTLVAFLTYRFSRNLVISSIVSICCGFIILGIGVSRVYLGVHYPSDVLAGFLAGCGWFLTVLVVDKTLLAYRQYRKK